MMKHKRENYIPRGATKVSDRHSSAVAYIADREAGGRMMYILVAFHGRAQKPDLNVWFRTPEERERRVRERFAGQKAHEDSKRERMASRKGWKHPYKVGDVFKSSWGYDQTNVNYYQCVGLRGKTQLVVREIGVEREATDCWEQYKVVPAIGKFIGEPMVKRAQKGGIRINSVQWASYQEPLSTVGGVPVYSASHETKYA